MLRSKGESGEEASVKADRAWVHLRPFDERCGEADAGGSNCRCDEGFVYCQGLHERTLSAF